MNWCTKISVPRTSAAVLVLLGLAVPGAGAAEVSLQEALQTPADDLAQAYLSTNYVLQKILPYAASGVVATIHVGADEITAKNAADYTQRYEARREIYSVAMRQRGQLRLAGTYTGEATDSCARVGALWISPILSGDATEIRIEQDGADAALVVSMPLDGKIQSLRSEAAVVETSIVIVDPMNADYYFRGQVEDGRVVIRPDIRVLSGWPDWASPPKRKDILGCVVELTAVAVPAVAE